MTNGASSQITGKSASAVGSRVADGLPQLDRVVSNTARHAAPRNISGVIAEQAMDRSIGTATSLANVALQAGDAQPEDWTSAMIEGGANGGRGPTAARHAQTSTPVRSMHDQTQSLEG